MIRARHAAVLAGLALSSALSCGNGSDLVSCTSVESAGAAGLVGICEEVAAADGPPLRAACPPAGQPAGGATLTYADAPCSRAGVIGGCRFKQAGSTATNWFYSNGTPPGKTAGEVRAMCESLDPPGTFLTP